MLDGCVAEHECIIRIIFIREFGRRFQCGIKTDVDFCTTFRAAFGGDEDDTVGTFHTIDSCRRCVFQDGYGLHGVDIY